MKPRARYTDAADLCGMCRQELKSLARPEVLTAFPVDRFGIPVARRDIVEAGSVPESKRCRRCDILPREEVTA